MSYKPGSMMWSSCSVLIMLCTTLMSASCSSYDTLSSKQNEKFEFVVLIKHYCNYCPFISFGHFLKQSAAIASNLVCTCNIE